MFLCSGLVSAKPGLEMVISQKLIVNVGKAVDVLVELLSSIVPSVIINALGVCENAGLQKLK